MLKRKVPGERGQPAFSSYLGDTRRGGTDLGKRKRCFEMDTRNTLTPEWLLALQIDLYVDPTHLECTSILAKAIGNTFQMTTGNELR